MNLKVLMILIIYWSIWLAIMTIGIADGSNAFYNANYNMTGTLNSSGFDSTEIDTGFTFLSFLAVLTSIGRFIGLAFFGLTPVLTGISQILFSLWQSGLTIFTIGFIIDAIWGG